MRKSKSEISITELREKKVGINDRKIKNKKSKMKITLKILGLLVFVFVAYNLIKFSVGGESTVIAELDTMEKSYKFEGIIIRDEKLISVDAKDGGILDVLVNENEMVRKGKHIATYYDSDIDEGTKNELAKINESISQLSNATDDTIAGHMSQKEIDEEIDNRINELSFASSDRSITFSASVKSDINELVKSRNSEETDDITVGERMEELLARKREIERTYSGQKFEITAPRHGVFSTRLDSFETEFTIDCAPDMTVTAYKTAKNKEVTANDIKNGGALCKIVDNSIWYISVEADEATVKSFTVGESVSIRFEGESSEAKGRVEYISLGESGRYMITISSTSYSNFAMENRFAKVTVVKDVTTGLKVPLKAIKVKDGKTGVYVKTENTLKYKEIDVLSKDETYAIVRFDNTRSNGLLLYDEIVIKD